MPLCPIEYVPVSVLIAAQKPWPFLSIPKPDTSVSVKNQGIQMIPSHHVLLQEQKEHLYSDFYHDTIYNMAAIEAIASP